ncbi:MAG: hypothetical protein U5O39_18970 [Gammaproteobacteria bacterium]|nr:hypothetical protein [Gammaproteobacteria bacterium]
MPSALDDASNDFQGTVNVGGSLSASLVDTNDISIGNVTTDGALSLTADAIDFGGTVDVCGQFTLLAGRWPRQYHPEQWHDPGGWREQPHGIGGGFHHARFGRQRFRSWRIGRHSYGYRRSGDLA